MQEKIIAQCAIYYAKKHKTCESIAERMEWIGDCILEEIVARCLFRYWHDGRSFDFNTLCMQLVSNAQLSKVFLLWHLDEYFPHLKVKQQGDVMEAILGELCMELLNGCTKKRRKLYLGCIDRCIADLIHLEKVDLVQSHQQNQKVAVNTFAVLCAEDEGDPVDSDKVDKVDSDKVDSTAVSSKSIKRCKRTESDYSNCISEKTTMDVDEKSRFVDIQLQDKRYADKGVSDLVHNMEKALRDPIEYLARRNVLKSYGTAILSQKVSLRLFEKYPNATPADLTIHRQDILSNVHLSQYAIELGMIEPPSKDEHRCVSNTFRSVIGYFMISSTWHLVDDIADYIMYQSTTEQSISFSKYVKQHTVSLLEIPLHQLPLASSRIQRLFTPSPPTSTFYRYRDLGDNTPSPKRPKASSDHERGRKVLAKFKNSNFMTSMESIILSFAQVHSFYK